MPMTTPCDNVDAVEETLKMSAEKDNQMKNNTDRFHLILNAGDSNQIQIENLLFKDIFYENT